MSTEQKFPNKGARLIPADPDKAREVRMRDRFFDFYVNDSMQKIFFDPFRPAGKNDPFGVEQAKDRLGKGYAMADCAAAPALFYARNFAPLDQHENLAAYAGRLMERPSFQRVVSEALPILQQMGFGKK